MEQEVKKNIPRDLFLHLLAIVTLYWFLISFAALTWQFINYYFPNSLVYQFYASFPTPLRFAVASLIIFLLGFIIVSWYLNKIYAKESKVEESKMVKWLIKLSGGKIKSEAMANYILLTLAVVIFVVSLFVFYSQLAPRTVSPSRALINPMQQNATLAPH
jgi:hypothetical protein